MSHGFSYIAVRRGTGISLTELSQSASVFAIDLANPWTDKITSITAEGDQLPTTEAELAQSLLQESEVTFQLWLSDDTDLACSFRRVGENVDVLAFGLDGLDSAEKERVSRWSIEWFKDRAKNGDALLLVIDRLGVSRDFDWDLTLKGRRAQPDILPEVVSANQREVQIDLDHYGGRKTQLRGGYLFSFSGDSSLY